jgi:hypothetical protein
MFSFKIFHFLVIKTLDPEQDPNPRPGPQLEKMLDPDPHKFNADPQPWPRGALPDEMGYYRYI